MSTEQIFDYLEGRLSADERAEFERRLASEPALQKDLEAAREVVRGLDALKKIAPPTDLLARTRRQISTGKSVVVESSETQRAWGFSSWMWPVAALVIVLLGIGFVFHRDEITKSNAPMASSMPAAVTGAVRGNVIGSGTLSMVNGDVALSSASSSLPAGNSMDLSQSLASAAERNLPTPILASEQIALPVSANEVAACVDEVIRIAHTVGGNAFKGAVLKTTPAGEEHILAYIPQDEIENFRRAVARLSPDDAELARVVVMDKLTELEREGVRKNLNESAKAEPALKPARAAQPLATDVVSSKEKSAKDQVKQLEKQKGLHGEQPVEKDAPTAAPAPAEPASIEVAGQSKGVASKREFKIRDREDSLEMKAPATQEPKSNREAGKIAENKSLTTLAPQAPPAPATPLPEPLLAGSFVNPNGKARTETKTGGEILTLNGSNTYTGGTTISSGTLTLGALIATGEDKSDPASRQGDLKSDGLVVPGVTGPQPDRQIGAREMVLNAGTLQSNALTDGDKDAAPKQPRQLIEIIIRTSPGGK